MVKSEGSRVKWNIWVPELGRRKRGTAGMASLVFCALVGTVMLGLAPAARAQGTSEFTLNAPLIDPNAIARGGVASIPITVGSVGGFSGSVNLTCQVTSNQTT